MKLALKAPKLRRRKRARDEEIAARDGAANVAETGAESASGTEATAGEERDPRFTWTTATSALAERATFVALFAALFAGALAFAMIITGVGMPTAAQQVVKDTGDHGAAAAANEQAAASAFAEKFVATWLSTPRGREADLAPYVADEVRDLVLPAQPWTVRDPATAGVANLGDGTWSVTVAVDVSVRGARAVRRQFFRVPITYSDGNLAAEALPAPAPAPRTAPVPESVYAEPVPDDAPVALAASDFLAALLTGNADVARFIEPGADITAVLPAPYRKVKVDDVYSDIASNEIADPPEDGEQVRLLVTATGQSDPDHQISFQYALTMRAREGRWEVATVDPAPAADPDQPAADPSTDGSSGAGSEGGQG